MGMGVYIRLPSAKQNTVVKMLVWWWWCEDLVHEVITNTNEIISFLLKIRKKKKPS